MPYSPVQIPNIANVRSIDSDTTIYISPPNNGLGKTGSTSNWTGLTWGNDSTGDGSLSKPYATLRRAWQHAQEYAIYGNATLYIQFQKGIYGYTFDPANKDGTNPFPDNLYHPNGNRIVIQGDPEALKQRYIYRVKDYSWDLSRVTYYGHTGTVNLWYAQHAQGQTVSGYQLSGNAVPFAGTTAHGFSAEDEFGYVSICNAAMSTASLYPYNDTLNGVFVNGKYNRARPTAPVSDRESSLSFMRFQFNHGLSHEESRGIWGLARIEGASANEFDLRLQFKNTNLDGRAVVLPGVSLNGKIPGGLGNTAYFGGLNTNPNSLTDMLSSNYPEPQYSVPNGYYGPTFGYNTVDTNIPPAWGNTGFAVSYGTGPDGYGVNLTYPSRQGTDVHVTDDPHVLTNFPAVIKVYVSSATMMSDNYTPLPRSQRPIPFMLDSCEVGSIRNLMVVNGDIEAQSYNKLPNGATLAPCHGFDADIDIDGRLGSTFLGRSPDCMVLVNRSKVKVRNLGMLGWGLDASHNGGGGTSIRISGGSVLSVDKCVTVDEYGETTGTSNLPGAIDGVIPSRVIPPGDGTPYTGSQNAELGELSNTPALVISNGGGILVTEQSSEFVGTVGRGNGMKDPVRSIHSTLVQTSLQNRYAITIQSNSRGTLGPTFVVSNSYAPGKYTMRMNLPVIPGATVFGGVSACFLHPSVFNNAGGRGVTYSSVVGFIQESSGRTPFARFFAGFNLGRTFANATNVGWGNVNTAWTASSGTVTKADIQNQPVTWHGVAINEHFIDLKDTLQDFLTTGKTLEFFAYHDVSEGVTVANNYLAFGANGVVIRTPSGVTITGTHTTYGFTYAYSGITSGFNNWDYQAISGSSTYPVSLYDYSSNGYGLLVQASEVVLEGSVLDVFGKSYLPILVSSGAKVESVYCNISLQNGAHNNFLASNSAKVLLYGGSMVLKNPQCFGISTKAGSSWNYGFMVRQGSEVRAWAPIVIVHNNLSTYAVWNKHSTKNKIGLFTAPHTTPPTDDVVFGPNPSFNDGAIFLIDSSALRLSTANYNPFVVAWDGGCIPVSTVSTGKFGCIGGGAELWGQSSIYYFWNTTQGKLLGNSTPRIMTRGGYGINGAAGQQLLYNAPRGVSAWFIAANGQGEGITSGFVGPKTGVGGAYAPENGTKNLGFMRPVSFGAGTYVNPVNNPQVSGGQTASPPGFAGPAMGSGAQFIQTDNLGN